MFGMGRGNGYGAEASNGSRMSEREFMAGLRESFGHSGKSRSVLSVFRPLRGLGDWVELVPPAAPGATGWRPLCGLAVKRQQCRFDSPRPGREFRHQSGSISVSCKRRRSQVVKSSFLRLPTSRY